MPVLSVITHVYNAQDGIDFQSRIWRTYSREVIESLEFIVIDDHSVPPLVVDSSDIRLRHFRVEDDIDWNMAGCRNLGALHASANWLLYFDCDNIITAEQMQALIQSISTLDPRKLYVFNRLEEGRLVDPHINTFLISRAGFFEVGGYDEDFVGHYGYEDVLFRNMWRMQMDGEVLITNIAFNQMGWRTENLNRDLDRNKNLIQKKVIEGCKKPMSLIRFNWKEFKSEGGR